MNRNVLLTVVGWLALVLYILACRPAWSPDGSKLLVSYEDPDRWQVGAAVVDVATGATRSIFVRDGESYDTVVFAEWADAGEHAILWFEEHEILLVPIESAGPIRSIELPHKVDRTWRGIAEIEGNLFFSGEAITKIELATGDVTLRDTDRELLLFAVANELFYLAGGDDYDEFGKVSLEDLTLEPSVHFNREGLERVGVDELLGFFALDSNRGRLALTGDSENGTCFVLFHDGAIERVLTPEFPVETYLLGDIAWSIDGDVIYAVSYTPTADEGVTEFSLAEIEFEGNATRLTSLGRIEERIEDSDDLWPLPIVVSPDGSRIAASTAYADGDDALSDANRAVFIVDLDEPTRTVTKVPFPPRDP